MQLYSYSSSETSLKQEGELNGHWKKNTYIYFFWYFGLLKNILSDYLKKDYRLNFKDKEKKCLL